MMMYDNYIRDEVSTTTMMTTTTIDDNVLLWWQRVTWQLMKWRLSTLILQYLNLFAMFFPFDEPADTGMVQIATYYGDVDDDSCTLEEKRVNKGLKQPDRRKFTGCWWAMRFGSGDRICGADVGEVRSGTSSVFLPQEHLTTWLLISVRCIPTIAFVAASLLLNLQRRVYTASSEHLN